MPLFVWGSDMEVGINSIDDEHKLLVTAVNDVYDMLKGGSDTVETLHRMERLGTMMEAHFSREEELFTLTGFNGTAHKDDHNRFRQRMAEIRAEIEHKPAAEVALDVLNFLIAWMSTHIYEYDKEYIAHFKAHGVT